MTKKAKELSALAVSKLKADGDYYVGAQTAYTYDSLNSPVYGVYVLLWEPVSTKQVKQFLVV